MRVGICTMFSFRPHVEHAAYLSLLLKEAGHDLYGLTCDAAVEHCYSRDLRGFGRVRGCARCIAGGLRTYPIPRVTAVNRALRAPLDKATLHRLTVSSVAVRFRTEPSSDLNTKQFEEAQRALYAPVEIVYGSARHWIEDNQVDAVLCFNGRMDLTAAVVTACEHAGLPYVTLERPWLGHGLHLVPGGNCLSLGWIGRFCDEYRGSPLTNQQARLVGKMAAERFLQRNVLEWRVYNPQSERAHWPAEGAGERILILPSSRNEFEGHPDRMCPWPDYTWAMDRVVSETGASSANCVLRCHPSWSETVGQNSGWRCERHYSKWGRDRGFTVIPSADRANTYDLIEASDIVLVNGSSAGMEAALRGKRVVSVGRCAWERAGFSVQIHDETQFSNLRKLSCHDPHSTVRAALRFMYTHARRYSQYVRYVRSLTTTRYKYFAGGDPSQLCAALFRGHLASDDAAFARNDDDESRVVDLVLRGAWPDLIDWGEPTIAMRRLTVRRRQGLAWVDRAREHLPRGDRIG